MFRYYSRMTYAHDSIQIVSRHSKIRSLLFGRRSSTDTGSWWIKKCTKLRRVYFFNTYSKLLRPQYMYGNPRDPVTSVQRFSLRIFLRIVFFFFISNRDKTSSRLRTPRHPAINHNPNAFCPVKDTVVLCNNNKACEFRL